MMNECEMLSGKTIGTAENRLEIPDLDTSSAVFMAAAVRGLRMCTTQGDE